MQIPGLNIGIVADDLTGACDTALRFFHGWNSVRVLPDAEKPISNDFRGGLSAGISHDECRHEHPNENQNTNPNANQVWSLNTASRHATPSEAQERVRRAVAFFRETLGVETFYKKLDSTLRGHIAPECLAAMEALHAQCAVIAPAYPQEGRRTVGGYQLIRGVPVEKTVVARDPLFPVCQSHLPTLLEQTGPPEMVGHIPLSVVLHGAGPILLKLNELIREGKKLVVADAAGTEDLEQIALAIEKMRKNTRILPCGSAGLAQALAGLWIVTPDPEEIRLPEPPHLPVAPILIMSGSTTETTRQQILRLTDHYPDYGQHSRLETFELSPEQLLGLSPVNTLIQRIVQALGERNTVVVSTGLTEESCPNTLALAQEHEASETQVGRLVQEALGRIASGVLMQKRVSLVSTGGKRPPRSVGRWGFRCWRCSLRRSRPFPCAGISVDTGLSQNPAASAVPWPWRTSFTT